MKQRKEEFKTFLDHNFGKYITDILLNKNTLSLNQGRSCDLYEGDEEKNKEQVLKLVEKSNHDEIKKFNWAFDFPGWIGELDFNKENVKDILVIGMEPHIGEGTRTAQVTYGLRETANNEFCELGEHLGNRRLWNNLNSLFNNNDNYYLEERYKNNQIDKDFFSQIYITDLAHFAVKGKAKDAKITNWKKIRKENADRYISRTIELIRPKYIVSQGKDVSNYINKLLRNQEKTNFEWNSSCFSDNRFPNFKCFKVNDNDIIHIILPHLASGNTNNYWLPKQKESRDPKMDKLRNQLKEFKILSQK
jgi:hypothetical protein